ncbi:hypothetical protein KC950_00015 [Candidatus Saccharibacteria bacterium]|nr:hypothetical protein [Candidatus Saccharibacteria bacterium]
MSDETKPDKVVISKKKLYVAAVILAEIALLIAVFLLGYNFGKDVGKKQAVVDESVGAISNLFGGIANPAQSTSGKVVSVNGSEITVETTTGEQETVKITEDTKITNKSKLITVNDIKAGGRASIFFDSTQEDGEFAARIIVNQE